MIKKKKMSVIVTAIILLLLAVVYFAVVRPIVNEQDEGTSLDLVDGEAEGPNGRYLMFPQIERDGIESIRIRNSSGEFAFVRDHSSENNSFIIEGFKGISLIDEKFSAAVVSSGYTLTRERVTREATKEDFERYGLTEPQASWTLTATDNTVYTVLVGDRLVSGDGYYAALEGRDECIYVLSTTIENSILQPVEAFVSPMLCAGMSQESYYLADSFTILHDGEVFVSVKQCTKDEFTNPESQAETKLIFPEGYKTDDSFYFNILSQFVSLSGEEAVYLGNDDSVGAQYGVGNPYYTIYFTYGDNIEYYIFVSELQDDGYYYAVSNLYNYQVIARCSSDTFSFLESDLTDWVDDYPIMYNITYVDKISVDTGSTAVNFTLNHGTDASGNATLTVETDDGFSLSNDEVYNFRQYYKVILSIQLGGNADLSDEEFDKLTSDDSALMSSITFYLKDGTSLKYEFRRYSTRRALLTCDGKGEFYVLADWIEKLTRDTERLLRGIDIDPYAKT